MGPRNFGHWVRLTDHKEIFDFPNVVLRVTFDSVPVRRQANVHRQSGRGRLT